MAYFKRKTYVFGALLVLLATSGMVRPDGDVEEATVEVEDEDDYQSPGISPEKAYLVENFDDINAFKKKWVKSEAKKQGVDENIAKYDGKWEVQAPSRTIFKKDLGLVLTSEAKHAAISTLLDRPFNFKDKPLVVQYEVTMQEPETSPALILLNRLTYLNEGQNCGGAYIKLLSRGTNTRADLKQFHDQTPYTIMFGPDKCGNNNQLHFIFRHVNPKNGTIQEKHSKKPTARLEDIYKDKEPHLYTLVVRPDNTFTVLVDSKEVNSGSLLEDFTPPVNPPEEIDDPHDKKPDSWDEREKIVDPTATKPDDWDESAPAQITDPNAVKPEGWLDDEPDVVPDPEARKPEDWDEEMDGEWEAPLVDNPACAAAPGCGPWQPPVIPNPEYKGVWRAPLISNPNYQGKWTPRRIPNPDYFRDDHPFKMTPIHAVGFELWSMSPALLFDNLVITDDEQLAAHFALLTFQQKKDKLSRDSDSVVERGLQYAGENPWVYALLVVGAFVVLGGAAYCCCGPRADQDVDVKKTDAVVEDDPHQSEGEEEGAEIEQDELQEQAASTGGEHGAQQEQTPLVDSEAAGDGQRKRKPRKE